MDWRWVVAVAGFLAAFLIGIVVERTIEQEDALCDVRERVACMECQCPKKRPD